MVATRRKSNSRSGSRKNKSKHSYFMRGCSGSNSRSCNRSNKHNFFAKGIDNIPKMKMRGKLSSKKCKCACQLNKHHVPECKCNCNQTNKVFTGGDALNLSLAYTGKNVPLSPSPSPSPYAAYVGKGGNHDASVNKAYPIVNDTAGKTGWLNSSQTIRGGGITGPGTSYANGLVGSSWTSNPETWSGVNGVGGDGNHLTLNNYNNDVSRQMLDIGANYPFNGMLSGGRRVRHRCGPHCGCSRIRSRRSNHKKNHRGGGFLPQNLVNVGRNFMNTIGASNNAMNGYAAPVKPMPFQDQLVTDNSKFLKYI